MRPGDVCEETRRRIVVTRRRRATRPLTTADLALGGHPAYAPGQMAQQPMWPQGTTPPPGPPPGPPPAPPRHPQQPFGPDR